MSEPNEREVALKWTREAPTEEPYRYYWKRLRGIVSMAYVVPTPDGSLRDLHEKHRIHSDVTEWAGPIAEPEE